ncbi:hypothetical protein BLS_004388 [Venturia inaequalis]|uniref:Uncharacterized protein n=1 Tax=Venturia inaequalis TaxID=5025 RepID=A0A8H3VA69_VENIN|nr:hypothetical protein BLS_004388 [Venturia inaequalis]KAE9987265.1 hypothetical protein EG328_003398 [Venturia inaequalis]
MPSLLCLPLELREYILTYALTSSTPPIDPENPCPTKEYLDLDYTSRIGGAGLRYSYAQRKHQTSPCGLLATNRQLHHETLQILARIKAQDGHKYALDMTVANEETIYASWSNVPPCARLIDELAITIHIHGTSLNPLVHNGFMDQQNGSTGPAIWRLYSILERFFRCGANDSTHPTQDKKLAVKTININILTPKPKPKSSTTTTTPLLLAPAEISLDRLCEYRAITPPHTHLMHPDALAKFMYVWVEGILRLCDPRYAVPGSPIAKYGKMFLQRIEVMKLRVDGVQKRVIDILEWVRELKEKEEQLRREEREIAAFEEASREAFRTGNGEWVGNGDWAGNGDWMGTGDWLGTGAMGSAFPPIVDTEVDLDAWTELTPVPEVSEEEELQAVAEENDTDPQGTAILSELLANDDTPNVAIPEDTLFAEILAGWDDVTET